MVVIIKPQPLDLSICQLVCGPRAVRDEHFFTSLRWRRFIWRREEKIDKKKFKSIDCKMLIMCHICGHIKRELFTRLSYNLVAARKLEMIINENARVRCGVFYDDNFQYFSDRKTFRLSCLRIYFVACKRSCWIFDEFN